MGYVLPGRMPRVPRPIPPPEPPPSLRVARPLPTYRYVPGLGPHPFRHPDGHAWCGGGPPPARPWDPATATRDDLRWRRALDLFDHRYLWEAHEAWEGLWVACARGSRDAEGLQGLIQLAASRLTRHLGEERASLNLVVRAATRLERVGEGGAVWRGLRVTGLVQAAYDVLQGGWPTLADAEEAPRAPAEARSWHSVSEKGGPRPEGPATVRAPEGPWASRSSSGST